MRKSFGNLESMEMLGVIKTELQIHTKLIYSNALEILFCFVLFFFLKMSHLLLLRCNNMERL